MTSTPRRNRSLPFCAAVLCAAIVAWCAATVAAQTPATAERGPQPLSADAIQKAIDALATVDATNTEAAFKARMAAARSLRRAPAAAVVPSLIKAVQGHQNQYVRFRALVLLTAFNDPRTPQLVHELIANPNDRVRAVVYMH